MIFQQFIFALHLFETIARVEDYWRQYNVEKDLRIECGLQIDLVLLNIVDLSTKNIRICLNAFGQLCRVGLIDRILKENYIFYLLVLSLCVIMSMFTLNHSVSGGNLSLYVGSPCGSTCMCTRVVFVPAYRMMAPTIKPEIVKETVVNTNSL